MTGYQEVFTDPSYSGQILIMNVPHIGNYGVSETDIESNKVQIKGLVCKSIASRFSRMTSNISIKDYLIDNNVVAIENIDTRALVQHIRNKGVMNCILSSEYDDIDILKQKIKELPSMEGLDLASSISTKETYYIGNEQANIKVAVIDFGIKRSMLQLIADRGAYIKVFPANSTFQEIKSFEPDGIFISNGPGDPSSNPEMIDFIKDVINSGIPTFGICLGHQLIALANGIPTFKMHTGHRGLNHPVKNLITGKSEITSQNHGFGVDREKAEESEEIEVTHINLNDNSLAGMKMKSKPVFSVQYHPESTPGSHDSRYLFDDFFTLIKSTQTKLS